MLSLVGIGASAGGLEALQAFLSAAPVDPRVAFVIVTHQHADRASMLPQLLARYTPMTVVQAADGMLISGGHVYVAPPGAPLIVDDTTLRIDSGDAAAALPFDRFLRTLARHWREQAVAVVLSGLGSDGTVGLKEVHAQSGLVLAQQPQSARFAAMPENAIATGLVDCVLPPAELAAWLAEYLLRVERRTVFEDDRGALDDRDSRAILAALHERTQHDFSSYKPATMSRRIHRRIALRRVDSPESYARLLREDPAEAAALFQELLIGVTTFFRDSEVFMALAAVLQEQLRTPEGARELRVWVVGCSTGEEAYSIAIVLRECYERLQLRPRVRIFATDPNPQSIDTARRGRYPEGIAADVTPERLKHFFDREVDGYAVKNEVRELVVFAPHNAIVDPPYSRLDLVSCRNLLIYLDVALQGRLLPVFHQALRPGGLLLLGSAETIGQSEPLFATVDRRCRIFRRTEISPARRRLLTPAYAMDRKSRGLNAVPADEPSVGDRARRVLLDTCVPPTMIVDAQGKVIYTHGKIGPFFELRSGEPSDDILELAREGLRVELATALRIATSSGLPVRRTGAVPGPGEVQLDVAIEARPIARGHGEGWIAVTLTAAPSGTAEVQGPREEGAAPEDRSAELELELHSAREELEATILHMEGSIESQLSSNEEIVSINEELQSTVEELQTTREAMQSLNEELQTVNVELRSRLDELSRAHDDMTNLLDHTEAATLFLDQRLCIRRFTPRMGRVMNLLPTDIGRPISDIRSKLQHDGVAEYAERTLRTLTSQELEVSTKQGSSYLMRIVPYTTAENAIDGLVVTFAETTRTKQAQALALDFVQRVMQTARGPLLMLNAELGVEWANDAFCRTFRHDGAELAGQGLFDGAATPWSRPPLQRLLREALNGGGSLADFRVEGDFPRLGDRVLLLNAARVDHPGQPARLLVAVEDVSDGRGTLQTGEPTVFQVGGCVEVPA